MNILLLGGTGFIGNALFNTLVVKHHVIVGSRSPIDGYPFWVKVDFLKPINWDSTLEEVSLVINAIGIIEGDFKTVQSTAPLLLYKKCKQKGIRVIHISAIGADIDNPPTPFLSSKKITDNFLLNYDKAKVIYPGIVIGKKGKSSRFFKELTQLPIIPLLSNKTLPFIHINQLSLLVDNVVARFDSYPIKIYALSKPESLKTIFSSIKGKKARFVTLSKFLISTLFFVFPKFSFGIFNKNTFVLFNTISATNYEPTFPEVSKSITPSSLDKGEELPKIIALYALSFIWIVSGLVSLFSWSESFKIMEEIGASNQVAVFLIVLGSFWDLLLGTLILLKKYRKKIIILQVFTMLVYMVILSFFAPHYWLHPFGVLTKNIPLLALSYYVYTKSK